MMVEISPKMSNGLAVCSQSKIEVHWIEAAIAVLPENN
jgi:hypothetical protein